STNNANLVITNAGPGTAVLNDVADTLTVTTSDQYVVLGGAGTADVSETDVYSGTIAGGVFTPTSGTVTYLSCSPVSGFGSAVCSGIGSTPTAPSALNSVGGSVTDGAPGGTVTYKHLASTGTSVGVSDVITFAASSSGGSTVPLPPAAW